MSNEDKTNGNEKVARLLDRAKGRFKSNHEETPEVSEETLELDVEDPHREQRIPPTLNEDGELELEDDSADEKKGENFLARMTLVQRAVLVGVVAVGVIGFQSMGGESKELAYLDQAPSSAVANQSTSSPEVSPGPSSTNVDNNGFEKIDQGAVSPDSNTIDLTPGAAEKSEENAFALDPLSPDVGNDSTELEQSSPIEPQLEPEQVASAPTAAANGNDNGGLPSNGIGFGDGISATDIAERDDFVTDQALGSMALDGEFAPPPSNRQGSAFSDPSSERSANPGQVEDITNKLATLNSDLRSLSQSVASIRGQVSDSVKTNQELRQDVRRLMSELRDRDEKIRDLESRPDITDLVIFRAAANCATCVPHALFAWQGKDVEVGDGLQWQGFDVAIRGDRLSLIKNDDVFHYWYR